MRHRPWIVFLYKTFHLVTMQGWTSLYRRRWPGILPHETILDPDKGQVGTGKRSRDDFYLHSLPLRLYEVEESTRLWFCTEIEILDLLHSHGDLNHKDKFPFLLELLRVLICRRVVLSLRTFLGVCIVVNWILFPLWHDITPFPCKSSLPQTN